MPLVLCPHRARCPGCPLMELPYAEQLEHKQRVLAQALAAYEGLRAAKVGATVGAEPTRDFRVRTKLVAEGAALGLFARGTHDVVDIPECQVLRPRLRSVTQALRRGLGLEALAAASSFDLREADDGVLVTAAVSGKLDATKRRALAESIAALDPNVLGVAVSTREEDAPQLLGSAAEVLFGPGEVRHRPDPAAPWHYAAHGAFTQAHAGQLARLHAALESELGATRALAGLRVLELYAGSGALSLRLAARGAVATMVETFAPAVRMAERAAAEQGLALRALAHDSGAALGELLRVGTRFDAVLVNPPRRGLGVEVRQRLAALAPLVVLYVSCSPETLARDAAHLALLGFGLEHATPFDMIPQSDAVETLARFVPAKPPTARVLTAGATHVAVEKAAHEAVALTPDGPIALLTRVRSQAEGAEAVAVDALRAGESGVCLFARSAGDARGVSEALRAGRAEWHALVRGVMHERGKLSLPSRPTGARYERVEVCGGHSLLRISAPTGSGEALAAALAKLGHPVLGETRHGDARANAHLLHRHALDRPFLHRSALVLDAPALALRAEAPLPPELALVLASLRAAPVRAR